MSVFRRTAAAGLAALTAGTPGCVRSRVADSPAAATEARATAPPATLAVERLRYLSDRGSAEAASAASVAMAGSTAPSLQAMVAARKLIRTAQVTLEVKGYEAAADAAARVAESHGGYLADAQAALGAGNRRRGTLVLRVPAESFPSAYAALKALGKVETETVATQDVTKAYADLETRLRVKRDAAARLREILRTRTDRLAHILEAERELTRVTEEIEQAEGERRYYDQQAALSTISATLHEPEPVVARAGAFAPFALALRGSLHALAASAAALLYVTVVVFPWLTVAALVGLVVRGVRRRTRGAAAAG